MAFADFEQALSNANQVDLTTVGRGSGEENSRPVWFVQEGETVYLLPVGGSDSQWYKNIVKTPDIRLGARGGEYSARGTPVTDRAKVDEIVDRFRSKYGHRDVEAYYPKRDVAVEVPPPA